MRSAGLSTRLQLVNVTLEAACHTKSESCKAGSKNSLADRKESLITRPKAMQRHERRPGGHECDNSTTTTNPAHQTFRDCMERGCSTIQYGYDTVPNPDKLGPILDIVRQIKRRLRPRRCQRLARLSHHADSLSRIPFVQICCFLMLSPRHDHMQWYACASHITVATMYIVNPANDRRHCISCY